MIAKEGHSVMWHTPLGLPVVQPYRRKDRQHVRTLLQVRCCCGGIRVCVCVRCGLRVGGMARVLRRVPVACPCASLRACFHTFCSLPSCPDPTHTLHASALESHRRTAFEEG
jgi:hypothetical protein